MPKKYFESLDKLQVESANPNGDCALNAFSLTLADPQKLAYIKAQFEKNKEDLTDFNRIATLIQKAPNRQQLQLSLAPILRQLAIRLIEKDPTRYYQGYAFNLQTVFTTGLQDDFCRHALFRKIC